MNMGGWGQPVRRGIVSIDIERYGRQEWSDRVRARLRRRLYRLVDDACVRTGISLSLATHDDTGDGLLLLIHSDVPTVRLVHPLATRLATGLARDNEPVPATEQLRLRVAVHAGDVIPDQYGHAGASLVHVARLLDAEATRLLLASNSTATMVLIVSDVVYESAVRNGQEGVDSADWHPILVHAKETTARAWVHVLGLVTQPPIPMALQAPRTGPIAQAPVLRSDSLPHAMQRFVGREAELHELQRMGRYLLALGEYGLGMPILERVLTLRQHVVGPTHIATAEAHHDLGRVFREQGNLTSARLHLERALAIHETVLAPDHLDISKCLDELGTLLTEQGELSASQPYFEPAAERLWAAEKGAQQGDLMAAKAHLERALAIRRRVLGLNHPDTANTISNLGRLLYDQGDSDAALSHLELALDIRERMLGLHHHATAAALHRMGRVLIGSDDRTARSCFERALTIRERTLGPDHIDTAHSLNSLGRVLREQGDPVTARLLLERAVAIMHRVYVAEHPAIQVVRYNLQRTT